MRNRVLGILAALTAVIGLSATAASAGTGPATGVNATGCSTSCEIFTNVDQGAGLGITYPGTGNQAVVTPAPGNSTVETTDSGTVHIRNHNGNCLQMLDAAHGHAVVEESGCQAGDLAEQWYQVSLGGHLYNYENATYTSEYLGVSCSPHKGSRLWGAKDVSGTCIGWLEY